MLARNIPGNAAVVQHGVTGLLFANPQVQGSQATAESCGSGAASPCAWQAGSSPCTVLVLPVGIPPAGQAAGCGAGLGEGAGGQREGVRGPVPLLAGRAGHLPAPGAAPAGGLGVPSTHQPLAPTRCPPQTLGPTCTFLANLRTRRWQPARDTVVRLTWL